MRGISLNPDQNASQNLSSGALNYIASYGKKFKLDQVFIKFSQAVTETITITLLSAKGSDYNTPIDLVLLNAETSFVWRPQGEANFQAGDRIQIQCTNVNGVGTAYLTIKSSSLGAG